MSDHEEIAAHYQRAQDVYAELGDLAGYETLTAPDFVGWYIRESHSDHDAVSDGFPQRARPTSLSGDLDVALGTTDRVLYAITSYKPTEVFEEWSYCRSGDEGTEWQENNPMPGYGSIAALPAWGDVDLADELKSRRGDLDEETRETIEEGLEAYIDAFGELYGTQDAVYALDSVGGAYVFGAPEATLPIYEYYDGDTDARARVYEGLCERMNEWLAERQEEIEAEHPAVAEVIDPDWVNNKNRQYKAPLSLHKDHDAVVTPLDIENPQYEITRFDDVSDEEYESATEWAASLTAVDHQSTIETLVENLWPTWSEATASWQETLDSWIQHERALDEQKERDRGRSDSKTIHATENASLTTDVSEVEQAIDALDIFDVAEKTIVHQWTEDKSDTRDTSGDGKKAFVPIWGRNANGTANYVDEKGVWVDSGQHVHGTAVEMALIAEEDWPRGRIASGQDWARGVQHLRELGFEIPVYIPEVGSKAADGEEYDEMPFWAIKRAAVALGVCPESAFVTQETEDGEEYEGFPGRETYENALEAIEDAGLEHGRRTEAQRKAVETVDKLTDVAKSADDVRDAFDGKWNDLYEAIGKLSQKDEEKIARLADQSDGISEYALRRHRELADYVEDGPGVFSEGNRLKVVDDSGRYKARPLLDFDINVLSFLHLENGSFMANIEIVPAAEPEARFEKQVSPKVFNRPQRFKDEILAERFSTTIEAEEMRDEDVLDYVRKYIHNQEAPELHGTEQMGLKDGEFVTPTGVIDESGWSEDANSVFVERDVGAERKFAVEPESTPQYDEDEVSEILELFPNTRTPERFLPVLGWFYAAPFRPMIVNRTGDYNMLSVEGRSGTGKSASIGALWKAFGMCENEALPFSCNNTVFTLITTFASSRGVPMWLDEYKPSDMSGYQSDRLHDLLRKAATGGTEQRGNADQTTEEYELRAPVCLTGEEGVIGNAEQRRAIQTRFRNEPTMDGTDENQRFKRLVGDVYVEDGSVDFDDDGGYDLFQHALAYYEYVTAMDDTEFVKQWRKALLYVEERIQQWDIQTELDDLERQGLQTVVYGYKQYRRFAEQMGADMDTIPGDESLDMALRHVVDADGVGRESHLDRYVTLLARAAVNGELEPNTHYKVVKENQPDEELRVNIAKVHDKITKYARDHDITEDLLAQAKDYRSRFEEEYETDSSYVVSYSQFTPPINRAVGIDMRRAEEKLDDFDRLVFADPDDEDRTTDSSEDGDDPGGTPVTQLEPGYQDITAEVASVVDPSPWLQAEGTLRDESGIIDYVARGETNPAESLEQGAKYHFKNARVEEGDDGLPKVEIRDGVTEISKLSASSNQSGLNAHDNEPTAADGGMDEPDMSQEDRIKQVKQQVTRLQGEGQAGAPVQAVVDELVDRGIDEDTAKHEIEQLEQKGELYSPATDELRCT